MAWRPEVNVFQLARRAKYLGGLGVMTLSLQATANEAPTIPYSGYLEADGEAVSNETRTFRFTFEPADGTPAATWQREYALDVVAGRFAVTFGSDVPLNGETVELPAWAASEPSLLLAVALQEPDGDWVLLGRQVLRPSRYALKSSTADGFVVDGNLSVEGAVTASPTSGSISGRWLRVGNPYPTAPGPGDITAAGTVKAGAIDVASLLSVSTYTVGANVGDSQTGGLTTSAPMTSTTRSVCLLTDVYYREADPGGTYSADRRCRIDEDSGIWRLYATANGADRSAGGAQRDDAYCAAVCLSW